MLLLQFQAGNDRYGLDASRVIEVVPLVVFRPLPHADPCVAGLFNYRGTMLEVTRGVGLVPPMFRFDCPPEITVLTLRQAPAPAVGAVLAPVHTRRLTSRWAALRGR